MLLFQNITVDSIGEIKDFLFKQNYRTCDYTIGGIIMWATYFNYKYCIYDDTLYIMGNDSLTKDSVSFAMPIGGSDINKSLMVLNEFCNTNSIPLILSSVPEEALPVLKSIFICSEKRLDDWADYIYNSQDIATLAGRKYHKKRNHVNQFIKAYPQFKYDRINEYNLEKVKDFFKIFQTQVSKDDELFKNEEQNVNEVLENYFKLGFIGGIITVDEEVVAFSIGEIVNDTLFVHIEKSSRLINGSAEIINQYFAKDFVDDSIKYINREEDVGDLGLRKSKLSYNPLKLIQKYHVEVQGLAH